MIRVFPRCRRKASKTDRVMTAVSWKSLDRQSRITCSLLMTKQSRLIFDQRLHKSGWELAQIVCYQRQNMNHLLKSEGKCDEDDKIDASSRVDKSIDQDTVRLL